LAQLAAPGAFAQLTDDFSDGDFSSNPAWTGNTSSWTVNTALRLQSNNTTANSSFWLSTPSKLATSAQWELYVQLAFNTSSANYVDIYLAADTEHAQGLVIIVTEPREFTVVSISGAIDLARLHSLQGHLGVPRLPATK